jgi:hypothetical protein
MPQKDVLSKSLHDTAIHRRTDSKPNILSKSLHNVPASSPGFNENKQADILSYSSHSEFPPIGGPDPNRPRRCGALFKPIPEASSNPDNENAEKEVVEQRRSYRPFDTESAPLDDTATAQEAPTVSQRDKIRESIAEAVKIVNSMPVAISIDGKKKSIYSSNITEETENKTVKGPVIDSPSPPAQRSPKSEVLGTPRKPETPSPSGVPIIRRASGSGSGRSNHVTKSSASAEKGASDLPSSPSFDAMSMDATTVLMSMKSPRMSSDATTVLMPATTEPKTSPRMPSSRGFKGYNSDSFNSLDLNLSSHGAAVRPSRNSGSISVNLETLYQIATTVEDLQYALDQQQEALSAQQKAINQIQSTLSNLLSGTRGKNSH